jgi:hypothetical protein
VTEFETKLLERLDSINAALNNLGEVLDDMNCAMWSEGGGPSYISSNTRTGIADVLRIMMGPD